MVDGDTTRSQFFNYQGKEAKVNTDCHLYSHSRRHSFPFSVHRPTPIAYQIGCMCDRFTYVHKAKRECPWNFAFAYDCRLHVRVVDGSVWLFEVCFWFWLIKKKMVEQLLFLHTLWIWLNMLEYLCHLSTFSRTRIHRHHLFTKLYICPSCHVPITLPVYLANFLSESPFFSLQSNLKILEILRPVLNIMQMTANKDFFCLEHN